MLPSLLALYECYFSSSVGLVGEVSRVKCVSLSFFAAFSSLSTDLNTLSSIVLSIEAVSCSSVCSVGSPRHHQRTSKDCLMSCDQIFQQPAITEQEAIPTHTRTHTHPHPHTHTHTPRGIISMYIQHCNAAHNQ